MIVRMITAVWRMNRILPFLIAALLVINGAMHGFIRFGMASGLHALEGRWIESQARSRRMDLQGEKAGAAGDVFRQGEADLAQFRKAMPGRDGFTSFLGELYSLAAGAGLGIDRVSYSPREEEMALLRYTLAFSVQGNYRQIKKFIHSLEQSPRLVAIEEISLSGTDGGQKTGVVLAMRLTTYFRSDHP